MPLVDAALACGMKVMRVLNMHLLLSPAWPAARLRYWSQWRHNAVPRGAAAEWPRYSTAYTAEDGAYIWRAVSGGAGLYPAALFAVA